MGHGKWEMLNLLHEWVPVKVYEHPYLEGRGNGIGAAFKTHTLGVSFA